MCKINLYMLLKCFGWILVWGDLWSFEPTNYLFLSSLTALTLTASYLFLNCPSKLRNKYIAVIYQDMFTTDTDSKEEEKDLTWYTNLRSLWTLIFKFYARYTKNYTGKLHWYGLSTPHFKTTILMGAQTDAS